MASIQFETPTVIGHVIWCPKLGIPVCIDYEKTRIQVEIGELSVGINLQVECMCHEYHTITLKIFDPNVFMKKKVKNDMKFFMGWLEEEKWLQRLDG